MREFLKQLFLWLVYLFPALAAFGQDIRPYPMEEKALLWKAIDPEKKGEVYLFGTTHLIEKAYFYFPKKLEKIIEKADLVVMEMPGMPDPMESMSLMMLKEGSIFDFFTPEQSDSILHWMEVNMGMDENTFRMTLSKLKPFALAAMIMQAGFTEETESYELKIEKLAKTNKIPLDGFETAADQMSYFDGLTSAQQAEMVMESIRDTNAIASIREMEILYQAQDLDGMYQHIAEQGGTIQEMEDIILSGRNHNWLNQMPRFFNGKSVFIAVGAGHLGGPGGLIRLMEENGYILSPVEL